MELIELTLNGNVVINKGSTKILNKTTCPECGKEMTRALISHDLYKMYTVISCNEHPLIVWEDVFNKRDIDTSQDYTNADERFGKHY